MDLVEEINDALLRDAERRGVGASPGSITLSRREQILARVIARNIAASRITDSDARALRNLQGEDA